MKKSLALLLAASSIVTITTPILAASCNKKEVNKEEFKEKKEFKELIEKEEANLKVDSKLSKEAKEKINNLIKEAKQNLLRLKNANELSDAISKFKNAIKDIKDEKSTTEPTNPSQPIAPKKPIIPSQPTEPHDFLKRISDWNSIFIDSPTGSDITGFDFYPYYGKHEIKKVIDSLNFYVENILIKEVNKNDEVENSKEKEITSLRDKKISEIKDKYNKLKKEFENNHESSLLLSKILENESVEDESKLIDEELDEIKETLKEASEQLNEYQSIIDQSKKLLTEANMLQKEIESKGELVKTIKEPQDKEKLDEINKDIETKTRRKSEIDKSLSEINNKLAEANLFVREYEADVKRLNKELEQAKAAKEEITKKLVEYKNNVKKLNSTIEEFEKLDKLEDEEIKEIMEEFNEEIQDLNFYYYEEEQNKKKEINRIKSLISKLEKIIDKHKKQ
ncbi:coiled-coil domain-containing protein [Metamycoplasma auris]|uniref:Lipoprotein n=1 Tax=Metamycoplasma auris TaxID=51363 RepID=A0A2W7G474_9BACT|nr:hypothetical protein [Metamycoplasma auris]PZV99870.1 hypothetical protein BCF89_10630 [Metamycoplasma auris]